MAELTQYALERMLRNETIQNPILQITGLKRIEGGGQSSARYRVTLNDGVHMTSSALLSTQQNEAAARGDFDVYSVIEVIDFLCNKVQNRQIIILLDFNVLRRGTEVQEEIGSPVALELASIEGDAGGAPHSGQRTAFGNQQQRQNVTPPILRDSAPANNAARSVAVTHQPARNGAPAQAAPPNIFPLASITPYQNKWCVRVRVTKKYPTRTYNNPRGEGKLFSVDLADESGEMKATAFNQECDKYYEFLKEGAVYYIKSGSIKAANRKFSSINNDYELTFNSETQIEPCFEDNVFQMPTVTFNFVKLDKLPSVQDRVIDVVGVVETVSQIQTIMSRKMNQELKKREVRLVDDSMTSVSLTMWGEEAEGFDPEGHPVVAFKGVRVSEYNGGVQLSTIRGVQIHNNPDVPEAHRLRGWYDTSGHDAPMKSLSTAGGPGQGSGGGNYLALAVAEADRLGTSDKPDYFNVKGFISHIKKENCLYKACATEDCNKKAIDQGTGRYRCEKCNKENDTFKWRMMMQMTITDFSGAHDITLFNEQAEQLIGMSAQDLADLKERSNDEFNAAVDKIQYKQCLFRLKARTEFYNDESRIKFQCSRMEDLNMAEYCKFLTEEIKKMELMADPM